MGKHLQDSVHSRCTCFRSCRIKVYRKEKQGGCPLLDANKHTRIVDCFLNIRESNFFFRFTLFNAKHGESILIGLAASSTSKGPQVKTTEPIDSIKVINCIIQLG